MLYGPSARIGITLTPSGLTYPNPPSTMTPSPDFSHSHR